MAYSRGVENRQKHHRLTNSSYYSEHSQFAHDPPGHTCGLPCCNSDLYVHLKVQGHHAGCMAIPFLHRKIIQDNFTFRKHQRNLLTGKPTFTNGFHSLQPSKICNRKPLPKFGTTRNLFYAGASSTDPGNTLDHELSENQGHFLSGREITLPKNINQVYDKYHLKDFDMGESADVEISDSESSSSDSSSDTDYYAKIPSIKEDYTSEITRLPSNLIYPWDLLKSSKESVCDTKPDEDKNDCSLPKIGRIDCKNVKEENESVIIHSTMPSITGTQILGKTLENGSSGWVTNDANNERIQTENTECDKSHYEDTTSGANSQNSKTDECFLSSDMDSNEDSHNAKSDINYSTGSITDRNSQTSKLVGDKVKGTKSDSDFSHSGHIHNNVYDAKSGGNAHNIDPRGHDVKVTDSIMENHADINLDSVSVDTRKGEQAIDGYNKNDTDPIYYDIMSDLNFDRCDKRFRISSPDVRRTNQKSRSLPVSSKMGGYETLSFQNNMFKNHQFKANWRQHFNIETGTNDTRRHTLDRATNLGNAVKVEVDIHEPGSTTRRADVTIDHRVTSKIDQLVSRPNTEFYIGEKPPTSNKLHIRTPDDEGRRKETKPPLPRRINSKLNTVGDRFDRTCAETLLDGGINLNNSEQTGSKGNEQFSGDKRSVSSNMYLTCDKEDLGSPSTKEKTKHRTCIPETEELYLQIKRDLEDDNDGYDQFVVRTKKSQNTKILDCVKSGGPNIPCDDSVENMQSDKIAILAYAKVDFKDSQERLAVINEGFENEEDVNFIQDGDQDDATLKTNLDGNQTQNGEMSTVSPNDNQDKSPNQEIQSKRNQSNWNNQENASDCSVNGEGKACSVDSVMAPPIFHDEVPITLIL